MCHLLYYQCKNVGKDGGGRSAYERAHALTELASSEVTQTCEVDNLTEVDNLRDTSPGGNTFQVTKTSCSIGCPTGICFGPTPLFDLY